MAARRFKFASASDCPDRDAHTTCPSGYIEWHAWAGKKSRTHRQIECETCGFFAIWILRMTRTLHPDTPEER